MEMARRYWLGRSARRGYCSGEERSFISVQYWGKMSSGGAAIIIFKFERLYRPSILFPVLQISASFGRTVHGSDPPDTPLEKDPRRVSAPRGPAAQLSS